MQKLLFYTVLPGYYNPGRFWFYTLVLINGEYREKSTNNVPMLNSPTFKIHH